MQADKLRTEYLQLSGTVALTKTSIEGKKEWAWARCDDLYEKMQMLRKAVEDIVEDVGPIAVAFLSGVSTAALKQAHPERIVCEALAALTEKLEPALALLRAHCDKIGAMHTIMSRA